MSLHSVPNSNNKRAYVVQAYHPNGGNYMAYHLARILNLDFDYNICVLTDDIQQLQHGPRQDIFEYNPVYPCKPISDATQLVSRNDLFICNPSYSHLNFGLKLSGLKIMYIQGFTTFTFLDRFFDKYVTVSQFVNSFIKNTYNLETHTIPPFIQDNILEPNEGITPWETREPGSLHLNLKGDLDQQAHLLSNLRSEIKARDSGVEAEIKWKKAMVATRVKLPHKALLAQIASARYFLTLSVAEGFGLVPLEAMAMGSTVMGFDGFGGRDYMKNGVNCSVRPYPDIAGLAEQIIQVVRNPKYAQQLALEGQLTAKKYTYAEFRKAWITEFKAILNVH